MAAVEAESEIDAGDVAAQLEAKELTPEDWNSCTLTIPDTTETQAFGRSKIKLYFNIHVNGTFYRGYRYSELNTLHNNLKKDCADEAKAFPKFPPKNRLSIGGTSLRQNEERRTMLEKYLKHVVTRPPITKHAVFNTFVMLKPDFDEIEEELTAKVAALSEINEAKWKQTTEKHGVKIWTLDEKLDGSNFLVVRTYVKVGASLKNVCDTYNTKSEWTHWQPDLKVCKAVDKIVGEETDMPCKEVVYAAYKVPVVSNRDVSIYCSRYSGTPTDRNDANSATALSYSIMHPNIPEVKGFVRGNMNVAQTTFTAVDGGKACEVKSIMHMDPRGMLPAGLVNTMVTQSVDTIRDMRVYMEQKYA